MEFRLFAGWTKIDMKKVITAGGLVLRSKKGNKEIILVRFDPGLIFPKGHVEEGENLEETALREVEEETGLRDLSIVKNLGVVTRKSIEDSGEEVMKEIRLYLMKTDNYTQVAHEEDCEWISLIEDSSLMKFPEEAEFLEQKKKEIGLLNL